MASFPGKLFDALLDRTIAAGYSRVGYVVRERFWPALDPGALDGATVLVTGANSGIGKAIAAGAAELGATVLMTVRDRARGEAARLQAAASAALTRLNLAGGMAT